MKKLLMSAVAWAVIIALTAVVCLGVSLAVVAATGSVCALFAVYFFASVLILLWLGAFD